MKDLLDMSYTELLNYALDAQQDLDALAEKNAELRAKNTRLQHDVDKMTEENEACAIAAGLTIDCCHPLGIVRKLIKENAELKARLEKAVELPCKVGDIIYFAIDSRWNEAEVSRIIIREKEIMIGWVQYDRGTEITEIWDADEVELSDLGITWFLTREAAEARLKELTGLEKELKELNNG